MEVCTVSTSSGDADCYIIVKLLSGIQTHHAKGFCFALRNVLDGQH